MIKKWCVLLLATLVIASCSNTISIYSDYDKTVNFSQYITYTFYVKNDQEQPAFKHIKEAIRNEMKQKGYKEGETEQLTIMVDGKIEERTETVVDQSAVGRGWDPTYNGRDMYDVREYKYDEGTLVISFVDTKKRLMIFEIVGKGEMNKRTLQEENIKRIIHEMLLHYPNRKEKSKERVN